MRFLAIPSVALLATATPAQAEFLKLSDDLTIHYRTAGEGAQVVLLVPGWAMSSEVFGKQLNHFRDSKTHRIIAIDPRSQGLSTQTIEGNYYEQHGRDLALFIEGMELDGIVLGGWSNGGFDILSYVHQFGPDRIKGLIMIDAAPRGSAEDASTEWAWFRKDDADDYRKYFTQGMLNDRETLADEFARWMVVDPTPDYMTWMQGIMYQTSAGVAALLNESSAYQDYAEDLKGLEGHVRLTYLTVPESEAKVRDWASGNTPSAEIVVVPKHLSFWEQPAALNAVIEGFQ